MELTEEQFQRYARHLILDEVGEEGQVRLLSSRVLVVGAGGLGSPLLLYLAAAGVGTLGITDADRVDLTNLQRQIVHATDRIGALKVDSARQTLAAVNPGVRVETHPLRLGPDNAEALIGSYDLVADGSDNFETRYLLTDLCYRLEKPLVAAALSPFEGQLSSFRPYLGLAAGPVIVRKVGAAAADVPDRLQGDHVAAPAGASSRTRKLGIGPASSTIGHGRALVSGSSSAMGCAGPAGGVMGCGC